MRDIAATLRAWMDEGKPFALASVVDIVGASPRPLGTALAVDADGIAVGGVSGGCVEAAVYGRCQEVLETGAAAVDTYGATEEERFFLGITCDGTMDVLVVRVEPDDPAINATLDAVLAGESASLVRVVEGPDLGAAVAISANGFAGRLELGAIDLPSASGRVGRFAVEAYSPPPELYVYGAVDFAAPIVRIARTVGFKVTVCDARPVFATEIRFPEADAIVVDWPHRHFAAAEVDATTAVVVLTHDEKFDLPLLELALVSEAGYVGALGSRATHRDRLERLREAGLSEEALARLRSPIGLDLNGRTADETALSIVAEIVAVRNDARAGFLTGAEGPIHH
jgi:xanthine dehydrogenase accessory factor